MFASSQLVEESNSRTDDPHTCILTQTVRDNAVTGKSRSVAGIILETNQLDILNDSW